MLVTFISSLPPPHLLKFKPLHPLSLSHLPLDNLPALTAVICSSSSLSSIFCIYQTVALSELTGYTPYILLTKNVPSSYKLHPLCSWFGTPLRPL